MSLTMSQLAYEAEEVCTGLQPFIDNLPEVSELDDAMEDLITLSECMHTMGREFPGYARRSKRSAEDVDLLLRSLDFTMDRMKEMFRATRYRRPDGTRPYRRAWEDLVVGLRQEEKGPGLGSRMEVYSMFMKGILDSYRGKTLQAGEMQHHRDWIIRVLRRQELGITSETSSMTDAFAGMSFSATPTPPTMFPPMPPFFQRQSSTSTPRPPKFSPPQPPPVGKMPGGWDEWDGPGSPPPFAPDPPSPYPGSPTSSDATFVSQNTYSSNSSARRPPNSRTSSGKTKSHWATTIFDGRHTTTVFSLRGPPTVCYGKPEVGLIDKLAKECFQEVLRLSFESSNVTARLYWRPDTQRARVLLTSMDAYNRPSRSCIPLTALKVVRKATSLELHRLDRESYHLELWANLTFDVYERLVLFYSAFAAMKAQDPRPCPDALSNYFYTKERSEEQIRFAGVITDQGYQHALRLFEDRDCGGLRLEARPHRGTKQKTPIWTAFVSTEVMRSDWAQWVKGGIVILKKLKPYVFCEFYEPLRGASALAPGEARLEFSSPNDATSFLDVLDELRRND